MPEDPDEEVQEELRQSPGTVASLVWAARSLTEIAQKRAFERVGGGTEYEHLTDKEVRTSLEATTINVCNRLDAILCDEKLWNFGKPDKETEARNRAQARLRSHPVLALAVSVECKDGVVCVSLPGGAKAPRASGPNFEAALDALYFVLNPDTKNPT